MRLIRRRVWQTHQGWYSEALARSYSVNVPGLVNYRAVIYALPKSDFNPDKTGRYGVLRGEASNFLRTILVRRE